MSKRDDELVIQPQPKPHKFGEWAIPEGAAVRYLSAVIHGNPENKWYMPDASGTPRQWFIPLRNEAK